MSKKYNIITVVGETEDGLLSVDGIWKMFESHGMPLDILFTCCIQKKLIPNWICLYKQMRSSGMKHDRILSKLEEALNDSYGKIFGDVVISTLDKIFKIQEKQ